MGGADASPAGDGVDAAAAAASVWKTIGVCLRPADFVDAAGAAAAAGLLPESGANFCCRSLRMASMLRGAKMSCGASTAAGEGTARGRAALPATAARLAKGCCCRAACLPSSCPDCSSESLPSRRLRCEASAPARPGPLAAATSSGTSVPRASCSAVMAKPRAPAARRRGPRPPSESWSRSGRLPACCWLSSRSLAGAEAVPSLPASLAGIPPGAAAAAGALRG